MALPVAAQCRHGVGVAASGVNRQQSGCDVDDRFARRTMTGRAIALAYAQERGFVFAPLDLLDD
jgi:hypothetical protein